MNDNNIYIVSEILSAVIILILMYANTYEVKQHSKKRDLFTRMLLVSEIAVVADAVSWMKFDWDKCIFALNALITIAYVFPGLMKVFFSLYLYEHISMKTSVSRIPFLLVMHCSMLEGIVTFLFCISGKLFFIQDTVVYDGPFTSAYVLINLISMFGFIGIIIINAKKMRAHDIVAIVPFCILPIFALAFTITTGLNVTIMMMAISALIMYVMLQSEQESFLFGKANIDELTGLYNRTAYEDEIEDLKETLEETLVYAAIDLNGLKVVNDTLGHAAGDEIICGAAECIRTTLEKYGKVFRVGGDEFVAIFNADETTLQSLKEKLEATTQQWKGTLVTSLTLSVGFVTRKECPDLSIVELAKVADKRMYNAKALFYANKGVDRRGQNNAYKVLCALYTKILKINITEDTYTIIDMNNSEQVEEKGYADSISMWLEGFGKSGQVHPEDLVEYLSKTNLEYMKNYFKSAKKSLIILYRRKYEEEFKQVMMEIVPTDEYSDEKQTLYLYVKNID